jgi:hypothetical protein
MNANNRFLDKCKAIKEVDLHREIIKPLLNEMGATHVMYCHGTRELGKDFYYLMAGAYGRTELHALQVKNKPFNASSGSPDSIHTLLSQVEIARDKPIAHPVTQKSSPPDRIVVMSPYGLLDSVLLGTESRITNLSRYVIFYCGEHFADLVSTYSPRLFSHVIGLTAAIADRQSDLLDTLPEAQVLGLHGASVTENTFTNLSVRLSCDTFLARLRTNGIPRDVPRAALANKHARDVCLIARGTKDLFRIADCFSRPETNHASHSQQTGSTGDHPAPLASDTAWYSNFNLGTCLNSAVEGCRRFDPSQDDATTLIQSIELLELAVTVTPHEYMRTSKPDVAAVESGLAIDKYSCDLIATSRSHWIITGCPGAGKTILARRLTRQLQTKSHNALYFPCSRITTPRTSLLDALERYVADLTQMDPLASRSQLSLINTYILDGCDEAASIDTRFINDLESLLMPSPITEKGALAAGGTSFVSLPEFLRDSVDIRVSGATAAVTIRKRLTALQQSSLSGLVAGATIEPLVKAALARHDLLPRVIATCRDSVTIDTGTHWLKGSLQPLRDDQVREFFGRWCESEKLSPAILLEYINEPMNQRIKEICRVPINATILFSLYRKQLPLPRNREDLYSKRFDLLLEEWDIGRGVPSRNRISKPIKLRFCSLLALRTHYKRLTSFSRSDATSMWSSRFAHQAGGASAEAVLAELMSNGVVVEAVGGHLSFGHLSYQEYLAAKGVLQCNAGRMLAKRCHEPWWRVVGVFYASMSDDVEGFIEDIQARGMIRRDDDGFLQELISERCINDSLRQLIDDFQAMDDEDEEYDLDEDEP